MKKENVGRTSSDSLETAHTRASPLGDQVSASTLLSSGLYGMPGVQMCVGWLGGQQKFPRLSRNLVLDRVRNTRKRFISVAFLCFV